MLASALINKNSVLSFLRTVSLRRVVYNLSVRYPYYSTHPYYLYFFQILSLVQWECHLLMGEILPCQNYGTCFEVNNPEKVEFEDGRRMSPFCSNLGVIKSYKMISKSYLQVSDDKEAESVILLNKSTEWRFLNQEWKNRNL